MATDFLNETFSTQESYVNLSQVGPRIIKQLLEPLRTQLSQNKDYDGHTKIQHYIKFSNQITLKAFLSYLVDQDVPFSKSTSSEKDSIELIIEKMNHLKQFYKTNRKGVEDMDLKKLDKATQRVSYRYLLLSDVNSDNYKIQDIDDENQSTIALLVLRYNKNIILAILKRNPKKINASHEKPKQQIQENKPIQSHQQNTFLEIIAEFSILLLLFYLGSLFIFKRIIGTGN